MFWVAAFCAVILCATNAVNGVTDKEYARMPDLFYYDNFDNCMLLLDEAFYCVVDFRLQPLNNNNVSSIWTTIQEVSAKPKNYRHDHLRHGICISLTCPHLTPQLLTNDPEKFKRDLAKCYGTKYHHMGLKGVMHEINCQTSESRYKIDWLDISAAVVFVLYILVVVVGSLYEGVARYQSPEEYTRLTESTTWGRVLSAFSVPRNWMRLKTIKESPDVERLRCIQGIRLYNMMIVTLSHSVLVILLSPIANPRYVETMTEKFMTLFLSSGGLCVSTFYFISAWLLTYHLFTAFEGRELKFKVLVHAFVNRYIRLIPLITVVVIFHSTWLVHLSDGPFWDTIMGEEYRNCRKNWWTNLLFMQNFFDSEHMCLQTSWYLAVDNMYFIMSLLVIWLMKKYERKIPLILVSLLSMSMLLSFTINYIKDFDGVIVPLPESLYLFRMFQMEQLQIQTNSFLMNTGGPVIGFGFGYLYYRYKDVKLFTNKMQIVIWWIITYSFPLGIIIIPGMLIMDDSIEHSAFWASVLIALSRPVYSFGIALAVFGMSQGIGWMTKFACEFRPTYVLGRITYAAYLVQVALVKITPSIRRTPVYASDFIIITQTLSDICVSLLAGTVLTLLFELPITELQKMLMKQTKERAAETELIKLKDNIQNVGSTNDATSTNGTKKIN